MTSTVDMGRKPEGVARARTTLAAFQALKRDGRLPDTHSFRSAFAPHADLCRIQMRQTLDPTDAAAFGRLFARAVDLIGHLDPGFAGAFAAQFADNASRVTNYAAAERLYPGTPDPLDRTSAILSAARLAKALLFQATYDAAPRMRDLLADEQRQRRQKATTPQPAKRQRRPAFG